MWKYQERKPEIDRETGSSGENDELSWVSSVWQWCIKPCKWKDNWWLAIGTSWYFTYKNKMHTNREKWCKMKKCALQYKRKVLYSWIICISGRETLQDSRVKRGIRKAKVACKSRTEGYSHQTRQHMLSRVLHNVTLTMTAQFNLHNAERWHSKKDHLWLQEEPVQSRPTAQLWSVDEHHLLVGSKHHVSGQWTQQHLQDAEKNWPHCHLHHFLWKHVREHRDLVQLVQLSAPCIENGENS